jgi:hypothetical protein
VKVSSQSTIDCTRSSKGVPVPGESSGDGALMKSDAMTANVPLPPL